MKALLVALMLSTGINIYPVAGVVTEVDRETDTVTFSTYGNAFSFYGCEDWEVGDGIAAIMSDNGTEEIYDDEIISVRYEVY